MRYEGSFPMSTYFLAATATSAVTAHLTRTSFVFSPPIRKRKPNQYLAPQISLPWRSKFGFNSLVVRKRDSLPAYGGYRTSSSFSIQPGVVATERRWVKTSKDALPR